MEIKTELNIDKAVKHLSWRLQQSKIAPNEKDKECFNLVLKTLNQNYEEAAMKDVLFGKLLIEKLMWLTMDGKRTMANAVETVKELLNYPLYKLAENFCKQVPLIRLSKAFEEEYVKINLTDDLYEHCKNIHQARNIMMENNKQKLLEEFTKPYTFEEFKAFIERLVFELKTEFQNKP